MENSQAIRQALSDFRKKSLAEFIEEFVPLLEQEGYSFEDLIDAMSCYAHSHKLEQVVYFLEEANNKYREVKNGDTSAKRFNSDSVLFTQHSTTVDRS